MTELSPEEKWTIYRALRAADEAVTDIRAHDSIRILIALNLVIDKGFNVEPNWDEEIDE